MPDRAASWPRAVTSGAAVPAVGPDGAVDEEPACCTGWSGQTGPASPPDGAAMPLVPKRAIVFL
jgi:hypothetical protein